MVGLFLVFLVRFVGEFLRLEILEEALRIGENCVVGQGNWMACCVTHRRSLCHVGLEGSVPVLINVLTGAIILSSFPN